MAELSGKSGAIHPTLATQGWGTPARRRIPASAQLWAVAWLRWRMFANSFRRRQAGSRQIVGLIFAILLRLIVWPMLALWVVGPVVGCGLLAWTAAHDHPDWMLPLLTGVALVWQFIAVNGMNIAASVPTFEPSSLLRFPVPFGRYFVLRSLIGLLTASTVVGCLALLAAAVGITIARPSLGMSAFVTLGFYALTNIYFARMIGIWMERWLATRRAREVFGALMAVVVIGAQFANFSATTRHLSRTNAAQQQGWLYQAAVHSSSVMHWLPPGFATRAVLRQGSAASQTGDVLLLLAWTALFAAGFAYRLHKQYLGEYLTEGPVRGAAGKTVTSAAKAAGTRIAVSGTGKPAPLSRTSPSENTMFSPTIHACLRKEWFYLRGNGNQFVSMVTPLIFVAIFCRGTLAHHPSYLLQAAVGYALLAPLATLYNCFGADGCGVQLYLIAPVHLRDVVLAKNLTSLALLGTQAVLAWALAVSLSTSRIPLLTQIAAVLWVVFVIGINLAVGTLRSIQSPRKFVPGQTRQMRGAPTGRTSNLLVLAILFGSLLLQVPVVWLCKHFHQPTLAVLIFTPLAAAGIGGYALLLRYADRLILDHRDTLAQELCGT